MNRKQALPRFIRKQKRMENFINDMSLTLEIGDQSTSQQKGDKIFQSYGFFSNREYVKIPTVASFDTYNTYSRLLF